METDETDMKSDEWIRARAKELYCLCSYGDIQVDSDAIISYGDDPGAYVAAWVWVPFEENKTTRRNEEVSEGAGSLQSLPSGIAREA